MERGETMSTVIRPELSEKNKYWIPKHRYYELKHFCLQYPAWRRTLESVNLIRSASVIGISNKSKSDPTGRDAVILEFCKKRMDILEKAIFDTDEYFAPYILKAVTEGLTFDLLRAITNIPCNREKYYDLYRRFFWILDRIRE